MTSRTSGAARGAVGRGVAASVIVLAWMATAGVASSQGHGSEDPSYETVIRSIEPRGLPIGVTVTDGDQMRIENQGDTEMILCGYTATECEPYVRLGPDGVYENTNSEAYYANQEEDSFGEVPDDVGTGRPTWKRVRREPAFYTWHDHRTHWMGGATLPPGVDDGDPARQKVNDWRIDFQYGGRDGSITGRLDYVGGRTFLARYGEYGLTGAAVLAMLVVFFVDARRRRRASDGGHVPPPEHGGQGIDPDDGLDPASVPPERVAVGTTGASGPVVVDDEPPPSGGAS